MPKGLDGFPFNMHDFHASSLDPLDIQKMDPKKGGDDEAKLGLDDLDNLMTIQLTSFKSTVDSWLKGAKPRKANKTAQHVNPESLLVNRPPRYSRMNVGFIIKTL